MAGIAELDISYHYAEYKQSIGFKPEELYVNAGVLLMNLAAMRRDQITNFLLSETVRLKDQIQFQDQDVINIALKGKILELPLRFNYTAEAMRQARLPLDEVVIFHYNSHHIKPWSAWDKNWTGQLKSSISLWRDNYLSVMRQYGGVSLIVAFHNQMANLSQTLHSLVNQSYHNFELILIDAASTDESAKICQAFAENDRRIHYHYQASTSLNEAKYQGIQVASRPYVLLIEEGDFLFEESLQALYDVAESTQADIVVGAFARFFKDRFQFLSYPSYQLARKSLTTISQEMEESDLRNLYYTKAWGNLYRRSLLHGITFRGNQERQEAFVWQAYQRAQTIQCFQQQTYVRRI